MLNVEAFDAPAALPLATLPAALIAPAAIVTGRYADRGYLTRTTDVPASTLYVARLLSEIEISQSVFDMLDVAGRVGQTVSEIELFNGDDAFNDVAALGRMDGQSITIKTSPVINRAASDWGSPLASAALIWQGRVARVDAIGLRARVGLNDLSDRFNTPLQSTRYDGSGGLAGGPAELKGRPMPVSFGNRFNVTPVYVGLIDLGNGLLPTYQTHWRAIAGHDAVRIRGVVQVGRGSAPGIGEWVDYPPLGCFQIGSTADGPVTCDVRGDAPATGTYAKTTPAVLQALLQSLGPGLSSSDFDVWSWFLIGSRLIGEIGWGAGTDDVNTGDAVNEILSGCGAWLAGGRAGTLRIAKLASPEVTPDFALDQGDVVDCTPSPLPASLQPTPQTVEVLAGRNWTPLDNLAGNVADADRAALVSPGSYERAFSNAIAARSTRTRTLSLPGLYRNSSDARDRATELRTWLERGLRVFTITTDRYLGQIELGQTGSVTYPYYGLAAGWSGTVIGWRERIGARRVEITLIG